MHHSDNPTNPEIQEMFAKRMVEQARKMQAEANELGLGATGKFPEGRLVDHDEGEIQLAVTHHEGKVVSISVRRWLLSVLHQGKRLK